MLNKIIVIDDDRDGLAIMQMILSEAGYHVHASPTFEILDRIPAIKPDLILLDHWMPDVLGSDICRRIKSNPATSYIPVLLVSAVCGLSKIAAACQAAAL